VKRAGSAVMPSEENALNLAAGCLRDLLAGPGLSFIQERLPAYLVRQRWFGAKSRTIASARVLDWVELPGASAATDSEKDRGVILSSGGAAAAEVEEPVLSLPKEPAGPCAAIVFIQITYAEGEPDIYQLLLALTTGTAADAVRANAPASILCSLTTAGGPAILHDGSAREDVRQALLSLIEAETQLAATISPSQDRPVIISPSQDKLVILSEGGAAAEVEGPAVVSGSAPSAKNLSATARTTPTLTGHASAAFATARGSGPLPARTGSAEQSNTSILFGSKLILKLFRRIQPGENPDAEIGRFLTEVAHYPRIPAFLGDIRGSRAPNAPLSEQTTLATLQGLIENEGDGWQHMLELLARYYEGAATRPPAKDTGSPASFLNPIGGEPVPADAREYAGSSLEAATLLGRRTAEMHLALATPTGNTAFQPEPFTAAALADSAARVRTQIVLALEALQRALPSLPAEPTAAAATLILSRRAALLARADAVAEVPPQQAGLRIRIHGDYHLGQVLCARGDYFILDFEGEPARSLAERRAKQSPLRDLAGMLRSFSYAAYAALDRFAQRHPGAARTLEPWALLWQNAVSTLFLAAWRATVASAAALNRSLPQLAPPPVPADRLLKAYLLEKALYELLYELNNRPAWVRLPLAGILALR
jgi:maltose alpha-D-glucosyltransferase/alpha-amylase